jgi:flagella basal body P-ring formation protein FlgA
MIRLLSFHGIAVLALAITLTAATPILADEVRGNLAMIEHDDHTFTLVDEENNILQGRFLVGGQVLINDEERTFWDVQPGARVTVTYDMEDGIMQVTRIRTERIN